MTWQQKSDLIQNYPVISATNFEHMVELFIEMVYLFHRVEFQQRGLPHIHAVFWVSTIVVA